jgi:PhnB protein
MEGSRMSAETSSQVIPNVYVDSVEEVRDFYIERLGFAHMMGVVGKDGRLDFCIVTRNGAMIMFARPQERIDGTAPAHPTPRPLSIYFEVGDVDAYHTDVKKRGAGIVEPPTTQWWGDRTFAVRDPYGYQLWFYQHVSEPAPPPGVTLV